MLQRQVARSFGADAVDLLLCYQVSNPCPSAESHRVNLYSLMASCVLPSDRPHQLSYTSLTYPSDMISPSSKRTRHPCLVITMQEKNLRVFSPRN